MKTLKPQELHESDFSDIREQLEKLFYSVIFKPIVELLAPHNAQVRTAARELKNAKVDPLVAGIYSGRIQYVDSTFSGEFNSSLSRELKRYGAKWNRKDRTFTILPEDLPLEVLQAAKEYEAAAKLVHDRLAARLAGIEASLGKTIAGESIKSAKTIKKMESSYNRAFGDALGREDLSAHARETLERDYDTNMKLWVKKFSEEMIMELRESVIDNAKTGARFDRLISRIQNRYDVTKSKAEFLARQETSLLFSKHREQRFGEIGIRQYVWRTAGDVEVRKGHKHLNGRTFSFASPPIVDEATGRRANPGEDYNCRCLAEPVLEGVLANA